MEVNNVQPDPAACRGSVAVTMNTNNENLGAHWPLTLLSSVTSVINMAVPLVLVRILSMDEVARYKTFFIYLGLVPWISMSGGLLQGLYHFAGTRDGKKLAGAAWSASFVLALLFALVLIPVVFFLQLGPAWDGAIRIGFLLAAVFSIPAPFFEENLVARGRIWQGAWLASGFEFVRVSGVLLAALLIKSVEAVIFTFAAITIGKSLVSLLGLFLSVNRGWMPLRPEYKDLKSVFRFAIPISVAGIFLVFATQIDQLILANALSPERFTLYSLGCLTLPFLTSFEQAVNKVLIPNLTDRIERGDSVQAANLFRRSIEELASVLIPAVVGLLTFASPIIRILFSDRYESASIFLLIYALFYLFPIIPFDAAARARGDAKWILRAYLISGTIGLASGLLLVPYFAEWGAMAAVFFAQAVLRIQGLFYVRVRMNWQWREVLPFAMLAKFAGVSILLSFGSFAVRGFFSDERLWFAIAGGIFSLIYFQAVLYDRLPRLLRRSA